MRRLALALAGVILVAGCGSSATPTPLGGSPTPSASDLLAPTDEPTESPAAQETPPATAEPGVTPEPTAAPTTKKYKVKKGDTLYGIAKKFKITVEALQAANPKVKAGNLKIGQTLIIPKK
jgi:LysM repeat protein